MDFSAIMLDANYRTFGVPATLVLRAGPTKSVAVTVIDKLAGVEIDAIGGGPQMGTIVPGATVRKAELVSLHVDEAFLDEGRLLMHGRDWLIKTIRQRPTPDGSGEVLLVLTEDEKHAAA